MPMIKLSDDTKLTAEVRKAIDKKLAEMEKLQDEVQTINFRDPEIAELAGIRGGKTLRINSDNAAWGVSYHT